MTNEPTNERLASLGLMAMAAAWIEQNRNADYTALPFDERFSLLIDAEWLARQNKRLKRRLAEAKLRMSHACLEGVDFPAARKLDKAMIRQLGTCRWVVEHQNIVITGATGTGKTYLACALAHQACLLSALTEMDPPALARSDPPHEAQLPLGFEIVSA